MVWREKSFLTPAGGGGGAGGVPKENSWQNQETTAILLVSKVQYN